VLRVAAWCGSHAVLEPRDALQQLYFSRGRERLFQRAHTVADDSTV